MATTGLSVDRVDLVNDATNTNTSQIIIFSDQSNKLELKMQLREAFKKKRRNIWKIPYLGGVSKGSFSICYNDTFEMHKKPF